MRGSIKLFTVRGISVNIHVTFFCCFFLFSYNGIKGIFLILGVFCFVTLHELCHSFVAQRFGITVKEITLLPIGGIASMAKIPKKPSEEFYISIAGPLLNIAVVLIFYFPLYFLVGPEKLHSFFSIGPSLSTWGHVLVYVYWINLVLAVFNLIPAFPMDGGRILRSILANYMGYKKATRIAVNFGHIFALLFGYWGFIHGNIILVFIAVFIYISASGEEVQVDVQETLKKFKVRDVLSSQFINIEKDATLSKVLELIFHSHQEDFSVVDNNRLVGFVTRNDIISGMHQYGKTCKVNTIMRINVPTLGEYDSLDKAQDIMQGNNIKALPVLRSGSVIGVVTVEDISRVYSVMSKRR